ncbi:MAG: hypothetical protein HXX10_02205 [Rhodoplanes sp.]|uniref:hypothetical protein n=1 Tax=Rhodoplanes sp. TaxID=1968906 RepID=UPI0018357DC2|nr:hypothetical protein [Rhodoplanes sp.]NVO12827.1 hypothetical protein [Rhodoplanes sp.]
MVYAFDTLGYATRLREAGVPQAQAEAHAMAARDFIMAELVTKADLQVTADALRASMDALDARLGGRIDLLESRIDKLGLQLTVRLGAMLAAAVAILAALQKLS